MREATGGSIARRRQRKGKRMSRPAKTNALSREPIHRLSDSEILLFISRTLQPQFDGADTPLIFGRLQSLKDMLDRQDAILPDLPDGPGKDRMADTLASAKTLLAQIADDLAGAAKIDSAESA
jgi:hypothetical protein